MNALITESYKMTVQRPTVIPSLLLSLLRRLAALNQQLPLSISLNAPKRNSLDRLLLNFYAYHGSNVQYCSTGANQDDIAWMKDAGEMSNGNGSK
jgi:hypothetical protein